MACVSYPNMIAVNPTNANQIYALFSNASGVDLYQSSNAGATWSVVQTGIPYFQTRLPYDISGLFTAGNRLFLATRGLGLWWTTW